MPVSPWLQKVADTRRLRVIGALFLLAGSWLTIAFVFGVVFPYLQFSKLNLWIIFTNGLGALIAALCLGAPFARSLSRRSVLHSFWVGPFYLWVAASLTALLGMLGYTIEQAFDPNPREGNPLFGLVTLLVLYTPVSFLLGIPLGLWAWRLLSLKN